MALWYICTFGLWYIWTLAHLYLLFSPIVVQMGDALSYKWGTHYRTNGGRPLSTFGGRIVVQMGDAAIDALSSPSYAPLSYKWGMIVVQMGDAHYQHLGDALSYRWGMLP